MGADGYVANPQELMQKAERWSQMSAEMQAMSTEAAGTESDFGLVPRAEPSHDRISGAATQWSGGASTEFEGLRGKLGGAAGRYLSTEQRNTDIAGGIG